MLLHHFAHVLVVTQLVDFYLGDESPLAAGDGPYHRPKRTRMGDKFALPNLEHMLALISLLARSADRPVGLEPERTPFSLEGLVALRVWVRVLSEGKEVLALDLIAHREERAAQRLGGDHTLGQRRRGAARGSMD